MHWKVGAKLGKSGSRGSRNFKLSSRLCHVRIYKPLGDRHPFCCMTHQCFDKLLVLVGTSWCRPKPANQSPAYRPKFFSTSKLSVKCMQYCDKCWRLHGWYSHCLGIRYHIAGNDSDITWCHTIDDVIVREDVRDYQPNSRNRTEDSDKLQKKLIKMSFGYLKSYFKFEVSILYKQYK